MNTISKTKSLELLKVLKDYKYKDKDEIDIWARNVKITIPKIFGPNSLHINEIVPNVDKILETAWLNQKLPYYEKMKRLLESFYFEIENLIEMDEDSNKVKRERINSDYKKLNKKEIFLVHGHDHSYLETVARFLEKIKLIPIILHEQANIGTTIIEKLEKYSNVSYAIIILTPDDIGTSATSPEKLGPRARQNVILELGYFMGKLGRKRICALMEKNIEIPSDYLGVLYIPLDKEGLWKSKLVKELKAVGFKILYKSLL